MLKKIVIYGERCSGTNYLEELLLLNFDVEIIITFGHKHFFGFENLTGNDDILFIGIVRNLVDWINSLYRNPYHLPSELTKDIESFLNNSFYSIYDDNSEIWNDRNLETYERYKNIFESRHIKNKFLVEKMPTKVKNYCLITYDNLIENFVDVMNKIKDYHLPVKSNINFPLNTYNYKKNVNEVFYKKTNEIQNEVIIEKANLFYEKILFPSLFITNA